MAPPPACLRGLYGLPCYLGYFWPLWDPEKQTFSDKVMNTIAVQA